MRATGCRMALALLLLAVMAAYAAEDCDTIERRLDAQVGMLSIAADQLGAFRSLGEAALESLKACPDSALLWYLAVRSAEVLETPLGGAAFAEYGGAKQIALDAVAHAPTSAAVATVLARLDGTVEAAWRAHELGPNYAPARRALALALAKEGKFNDALKLVTAAGAGGADRVARARILLAAGQPRQAAVEARKALERPQTDSAEPAPSSELLRDANEVLGFALLAQGRTNEALRPLRAAAGAGSRAAQAELAKRR